jgi:hypothetical protein
MVWCVSLGGVAALHELLPGILPQMGKDNLDMLKKLAEAYSRKAGEGGAVGLADSHPRSCLGLAMTFCVVCAQPGDDEDMPELVGNFEEASK